MMVLARMAWMNIEMDGLTKQKSNSRQHDQQGSGYQENNGAATSLAFEQ